MPLAEKKPGTIAEERHPYSCIPHTNRVSSMYDIAPLKTFIKSDPCMITQERRYLRPGNDGIGLHTCSYQKTDGAKFVRKGQPVQLVRCVL